MLKYQLLSFFGFFSFVYFAKTSVTTHPISLVIAFQDEIMQYVTASFCTEYVWPTSSHSLSPLTDNAVDLWAAVLTFRLMSGRWLLGHIGWWRGVLIHRSCREIPVHILPRGWLMPLTSVRLRQCRFDFLEPCVGCKPWTSRVPHPNSLSKPGSTASLQH